MIDQRGQRSKEAAGDGFLETEQEQMLKHRARVGAIGLISLAPPLPPSRSAFSLQTAAVCGEEKLRASAQTWNACVQACVCVCV